MKYTKELNKKTIIFSIISTLILIAILAGGTLIVLYSYNSDYVEPFIQYNYKIEEDKIIVTITAMANIKDFECDIRFCTLFNYFDHTIKIETLEKYQTEKFEFSTQAVSNKLDKKEIVWLNFPSESGRVQLIEYLKYYKNIK